MTGPAARRPASAKVRDRGTVRLRPEDPFDLVRLIARSQSDPRKAVAELVQNSLDAGAAHVRVTWASHKGRRSVSVWDDGRGVFPEMGREEALRRIATSLGASHKARLTAAQRHEQLTLGKYGIGLLGFWSVGTWMEIRSRVEGSDVWALRLREEGREGEVLRVRSGRLVAEPTFTEVVVTDVHDAAEPQIKPKRLAAYLAGELRGQLLQRDVRLEIHDRVGRGRAAKRLVVRPQKYRGTPVEGLTELPVAGFATARVELYLVPDGDERRGQVSLACGGTTVLDDLAWIDGIADPREPWSLGRFEGVIDFPDLDVAPTTRRGFVPNSAALALREALPPVEARLREVLARDEERRRAERDADVARDLRRMFRALPRALPHYDLPAVRSETRRDRDAEVGSGVTAEEPAAPPEVVAEDAESEEPPPPMLYPPGPLASVEIRPRRSVLPLEGSRRLRATALDADGRPAAGDVAFEWTLDGPGVLDARDASAAYAAPADPGTATIRVVATQGDLRVAGEATVETSDAVDPDPRGSGGIPDPEPVEAPGEDWRSRFEPGRWQYNTAHADYRHVAQDPRRRLRYLVHLFAKEIVLRNFGEPGDGELLERMVQVLAYVGEAKPRGAAARPAQPREA